jgi:hypothetical protein
MAASSPVKIVGSAANDPDYKLMINNSPRIISRLTKSRLTKCFGAPERYPKPSEMSHGKHADLSWLSRLVMQSWRSEHIRT